MRADGRSGASGVCRLRVSTPPTMRPMRAATGATEPSDALPATLGSTGSTFLSQFGSHLAERPGSSVSLLLTPFGRHAAARDAPDRTDPAA